MVNLGYDVLIVSQFTLHATLGKKHTPDFRQSMSPAPAEALFNEVVKLAREGHKGGLVQTGIFGAKMDVALTNDGPVTIVFDSPKDPSKDSAAEAGSAGKEAEEQAGGPTPATGAGGAPASEAPSLAHSALTTSAAAIAAAEVSSAGPANPADGNDDEGYTCVIPPKA